MKLPAPIVTLPEARSAYRRYLRFMREQPWAEGRSWDDTVQVVASYCRYVEEEPPNLEACGSLWLAMEKGGGGSSVLIESCPSLTEYGRYSEAEAWLHARAKEKVGDHQPLPLPLREEVWRRADKRRKKSIELKNKPQPTGATFENSPKGWAEMEKRMNLPPGTLTQPRNPKKPGPFIVVEKQPDGTDKFVVRKKFPGKIIAVSGPWYRQLWFKLTGR